MKRDMDLIRNVLLKVESGENYKDHVALGCTPQELAEHVLLLIENEFVEGTVAWMSGRGTKTPAAPHIFRIRWAGHEFLAASRNNATWAKAKEQIIKSGASFTLPLLLKALHHFAALALPGLPPPTGD